MMLFKISLKNIKKSFKDYAVYFFTLILGVAIFYVFNAIDSQTVMMNVTSSTKDIIKLMTQMLSGVSVFVSFILGFLIIYASRFLMKRRNKEFGIYLTLGMSKRKISGILFFETLFIGIISLILGLVAGAVLSQFMSVLVANMFEADLTNFTFVFSAEACIKTIIYFGIMYLLVMIFNTFNIGKCKLIDLIRSNSKSEKVKLKNPIICTIIFLISSASLGYAYYMVTAGIDAFQVADSILIPIAIGSVATFFIFWSLSGLIIRIVTTMKKTYYKDLNSFTVRQVSSKINTTVFSMTVICLMLFITICVLSSALSIRNSMSANLKSLAPVDVQFIKTLDLSKEEIKQASYKYNKNMIDDSHLKIEESLEKLDFDEKKYLKDLVEISVYSTDSVKIKDTLGSYYGQVRKKYPYLEVETKEDIVKVSDYNRIAKLFGLNELSLKENEYILVADYEEIAQIREDALKANTPIFLSGKAYYPKSIEYKNGFIYISSNHMNSGIFVVPDEAVNHVEKKESIISANYKAETEDSRQRIENRIRGLENHPYAKKTNLSATTKDYLYEASVGLGAMVTFIGLYLGIIFLISSAAILALKELSESSDNKERFKILRRIGADEKMINRALFRQIGIFFMFPLLIAMIHSVFGIMFSNHILETFGNEKLLESIIFTAVFIVFIYGGYFLITYLCSKSIIKER